MKAHLALSQRCPKCTLTIPCKHFQDSSDLFKHKTQLFKQDEWLLMSQQNRDQLIRAKANANQSPVKEAKTLLQLRLFANQFKNQAMIKRGKKPLTVREREQIDLGQQAQINDLFARSPENIIQDIQNAQEVHI